VEGTLGWIGIASAPTASGRFNLVVAEGFVVVIKQSNSGPSCPRNGRGHPNGPKRKSSLRAPRNAPLRTGREPGAETALFL
jgi:hypothetical protein